MTEPEGDVSELFIGTMRSFLELMFSTIPPEVAEKLLRDRPYEDVAEMMLGAIVAEVRGNRPDDACLDRNDLGLIMDKVAALHLVLRHGPDAPDALDLGIDFS